MMAQRLETLPEALAEEIRSTVSVLNQRVAAANEALSAQCRMAAAAMGLPKANWMPTPDCSALTADFPEAKEGK